MEIVILCLKDTRFNSRSRCLVIAAVAVVTTQSLIIPVIIWITILKFYRYIKKKNTCDDRKGFYCLEPSLWFGVRYHLHIRCQHVSHRAVLAPVLYTPVISRIIWTTGIANAVSMEEIDTKHLKQNKKEKIVLEVVEETTMSVSFGESRYNLQCDGSQTKVKCLFVTKNAEKTQSCLFNPRKHTLPKVGQT